MFVSFGKFRSIAALNLNIVQVIIKQYQQNPESALLEEAQTALERIKHIPEQHNQFKRLKHLTKVVEKLKTKQPS